MNSYDIVAIGASWGGLHAVGTVADADDKAALLAGRVIVAPAGYHLLVEDGRVELSCEDLVQFSRPSIDVLFESVAQEYGERAIGGVLTGANEDGACGLAEIARH